MTRLPWYDNEDRGAPIDLDSCKGCGLCAAECPCGAIQEEPEEV